MKKTLLSIALAALTVSSAMAVPAKPAFFTYIQPDGTQVELMPIGDENKHYYVTKDNIPVMDYNGGYYYATVDVYGEAVPSEILARPQDKRTKSEIDFIVGQDRNKFVTAFNNAPGRYDALYQERQDAVINPFSASRAATANTVDAVGHFESSTFPNVGSPKGLIILVEFPDQFFSMDDPHDYFTRWANEKGWSENGGTGSAKDYFRDASFGQFDPDFDVLGPVMLPHVVSHYGKNSGGAQGQDTYAWQMAVHACQELDIDDVDLSIYDADGDGEIEMIYVIYAGLGENTGGAADRVWAHNSKISNFNKGVYAIPTVFSGVNIDYYACSPELTTATLVDGIGVFCHEFGHVIGLPDLYNTAYSGQGYETPCEWSVMDRGSYTNMSNTPPTYSSFERNAMGWMKETLIPLVPSDEVFELLPLAETNTAYYVENTRLRNSAPQKKEFYLLENRKKSDWDIYLDFDRRDKGGMLIWHVAYVPSWFNNNVVNNYSGSTPTARRFMAVDLVEANGTDCSTNKNRQGHTFPGNSNVTEFLQGEMEDTAPKNFVFWDGNFPGFDIINIDYDATTFTSTFSTYDTTGVTDVVVDLEGETRYFNLSGMEIQNPLPGNIYIKVEGGKASKVLFK